MTAGSFYFRWHDAMTALARYPRFNIRTQPHVQLLKVPPVYFQRYPCMPGCDVRELELRLALQCEKSPDRTLHVCEWGCGGSTVYFTSQLAERNLTNWSWTAIDHDAEWSNCIREIVNPNVRVVLFDKQGIDPRAERDLDMEDYITFPRSEKRTYDLVIVDGRRRRRCIMEARELLSPIGICMVHDAQRSYYHCAMSMFPQSMFVPGTQWWIGRVAA